MGGCIILQVEETKAAKPSFGLPPPQFLPRRYKPRNVGSWSAHLAFANDLISALQPSLVVELGAHWGETYFTFCQTVEEQRLSCMCYAVDQWQGDQYVGGYGEEVFDDVNEYNTRYYRQFSYLLRQSFGDALSQFEDGSIDLLHIDGLHTYEAVSHDFRSWLPKVSSGGIILLQDISLRQADFGVWRLWDEIKAEFPDTFEFHHGWGLGVVAKGRPHRSSTLTELLFDGSPSARENLRRHYVIYASHLENILGRFPLAPGGPVADNSVPDIRVQVFPYGDHGYSEITSQIRPLRPGVWETLTFDLRAPINLGPLRIDPGSEPSFIEIGDVRIHSGKPEDLAFVCRSSSNERDISLAGTIRLPFNDGGSFLISFGDDPQIMFAVPAEIGSPATLTVSLRIFPASTQTIELFEFFTAQLKDGISRLQRQLAQHQQFQIEQRQRHEQQIVALQRESERLASDLKAESERLTSDLVAVRAESADLAARNRATQLALQQTQQKLLLAEDTVYRMHHSLSWKVTEPLRKLMALVRSGPRQPGR